MKYSNKKPKIGDLVCIKHHISTVSSGLILRDFEKIFGCLDPTVKHEHTDCLGKYFFVGSVGMVIDMKECAESNLVIYGGILPDDREISLKVESWVKCYARDYKDTEDKLLWVRAKNIIVI